MYNTIEAQKKWYNIVKNTQSKMTTFTFDVLAGDSIGFGIDVSYNYDYTIWWGDGTYDNIVDNSSSHTYTTAGTYEVKIRGTHDRVVLGTTAKTRLTKIHFGESFEFKYSMETFMSCSNLAEVTGQLNAPAMTTVYRFFSTCPNLTSLPYNFLYKCPNLTNLNGFAYSCNLNDLHVDFFSKCINAENFMFTLMGNNLTNEPDMSNNPKVTTFYAFLHGNNLQGTSRQLWLNNRNATNYTLTAPDYNDGEPAGNVCYYGNTDLTDYYTMPSFWRYGS